MKEVQRLLTVETGGEEFATKPQLVKALMMSDPSISDKQVGPN